MIREISPPAQRTLSVLLSTPEGRMRRFVFSTLLRLIRTASLDVLLKQPGPFKVFVPNDGAFARMPNEEFDDLVEPEREPWLVEVITYHIVPGYWPMASLMNRNVRAVNGERVIARQVGVHVLVNNARVVTEDIPARNGLMHEIDHVLLPRCRYEVASKKGERP